MTDTRRSRRISFGELVAMRILLRITDETLREALTSKSALQVKEKVKIAQTNLKALQELTRGTES